MLGQMMDEPLLISSIIRHASKFHGDVEVVYRDDDDSMRRYTYRDVDQRSKQLAQALVGYGINAGDRIATMAWNSHRHLELYYGVSGIGAVLHTINPRLFRDQILYIANHAKDRILFFDPAFTDMVEQLAGKLQTVEAFICLAPQSRIPESSLPIQSYDDFIASESGDFEWPTFDERTASSLCYTSGTTGQPRGALYSHRSTILHTINACTVDGHSVSGGDCILPAVPMFHGNAWGIPYSAAAAGAKLVLAGQQVDGATLIDLFHTEHVTMSLGVPTVWLGLLDHAERTGVRLDNLDRVIIGGSAVPQSLIERFRERHGVRVIQAWGMTEMSPLGSTAAPKHKHLDSGQDARDAITRTQGRPPYLVDAELVGQAGEVLPHDGATVGDLYVRGPWVIGSYYEDPQATADAFDRKGWLKTGDVCTIDPDGYIRIVDRSKDVIKSGGEWISTIELENIAVGHPAVAEAAVIAIKHPKWDERPLLVVVPRTGVSIDRREILRFFEGRVAKWWYPDDVVIANELPHTATGKVSKASLRDQFRAHVLPSARTA